MANARGRSVDASASTGQYPSGYGRKAVIGSAVGYAMDGFDLLILGFALASITASFGLSQTEAGLELSRS